MKYPRYAKTAAMAGAIVWLAGCASTSTMVVTEPLGPAPTEIAQEKGDGLLAIYSAQIPANVDVNTAKWRMNNDFGKNEFLNEPAHSDYIIYSANGEMLRRVRNSRDQNDDTPTTVPLPTGSYKIEAEAIACNSDRVKAQLTVVIKPGEKTVAHLQGGWRPRGQYDATELARLPCGRPIGWRASQGGLASAQ